ncbi:ras-related C3 botulinum toxin substrate 1-like [Condylostylus longicornis]|uniref:ras-related C3 botulinum toxin substrate 1-like n=1 Tax=Condylostylus longicornis TaxID=2530218 RepID=UPI00244DA851|nr:ras-related C3 botulinum toxin substrate 1-like [Condylostylus longicornis]
MASCESETDNVRCIIIGDSQVGKTSLIITTALGKFPEVIIPICSSDNFDYGKSVTYENKKLYLELWDVGNSEDFPIIRISTYTEADIFLICFSVVNKKSFENVKEKWYPEVRSKNSKTSIILIGTKTDLRNDDKISNDQECITYLDDEEMAKEIEEIFNEVAKIIANTPKKIAKKKNKCNLM